MLGDVPGDRGGSGSRQRQRQSLRQPQRLAVRQSLPVEHAQPQRLAEFVAVGQRLRQRLGVAELHAVQPQRQPQRQPQPIADTQRIGLAICQPVAVKKPVAVGVGLAECQPIAFTECQPIAFAVTFTERKRLAITVAIGQPQRLAI